jgi:hypothetical protein
MAARVADATLICAESVILALLFLVIIIYRPKDWGSARFHWIGCL